VKTQEVPRQHKATFTAEGGGWLVVQKPEPGLTGKTAAELLALGAELPGNLRYALRPGGKVVLIGEVRNLEAPIEEAQQRLQQWLDGPAASDAEPPSDEAVEAALEGSSFAWSRREHGWAVPANETLPREMQVQGTPRGLRIEAVLVEWDEIGATEAEALARFLLAAHAGLRFARCEWIEGRARLAATAASAHLDEDLRHGLLGVAASCRLLAREAVALLLPEAARLFLDFHGPAAEKLPRAAE
jgi:hypothetical protein